jgi:hypothetical protein
VTKENSFKIMKPEAPKITSKEFRKDGKEEEEIDFL